MAETLSGLSVALLVTNGFEEVELTEPRRALMAAGASARIVSPKKDKVRSWRNVEWGGEFDVDVPLLEARSEDYDALVLPGGVINADFLRLDSYAVGFAHDFFAAGKPVAAICHGLWLLVESGDVRGRHVTSFPSLKTDLANAGATWVDETVVVDGNLVTSRKPDDLPAFNEQIVRVFAGMSRESLGERLGR